MPGSIPYHSAASHTRPTDWKFVGKKVTQWIKKWGYEEGDSDTAKGKKFNLAAFALMMSLGGVLWGLICILFQLYTHATMPLVYTALTILNLQAFTWHRRLQGTLNFQLTISLLFPFALQFSLGGFQSSGYVMLWAVFAVIGSMLTQEKAATKTWFWLFILLTVAMMIIDPAIVYRTPDIITEEVSKTLFLLNLFLVLGMVINLTAFHIRKSTLNQHKLDLTIKELTQSVQLLVATQEQINHQSKVIQLNSEKINLQHTNLQDSIAYAKKLQLAVFRKHTVAKPKGVADWFVFERACDTISGDFIWTTEKNGISLVALADCTGHGVPGALLTMLGSSLLDQIVIEMGITDPQTILLKLHFLLKRTLGAQTGHHQGVPDGMDISLLAIDPTEGILTFSGAYQTLHQVQGDTLTTLKGDRKSIGANDRPQILWANQILPIVPNSTVYLSSDGYRDQFGGPQEKRFTTKRYRNLLTQLSPLPPEKQLTRLVMHFEEWKGNQPQTDDIAVVGLKF